MPDNGPQFTATEFEQFCTSNGILHRSSAAFKSSTNSQAERVVQILKSAIKQAHLTIADVDAVIANHLLVYRTTPHSTTGEPPSLLLIGRRLRNRLDLLTTSAEKYVEARQYITMLSRNTHRGFRTFSAGDSVVATNFGRGGKWVSGVVTEVLGSRHYIVRWQVICGNETHRPAVETPYRAQLFEDRLALNPGLNLTRVSFSYAQKHFLG